MPNIRKSPAFYGIDKAIERIGCSRATLYRWHQEAEESGDNTLAPFRYQPRPGSPWRYPVEELEQWLVGASERERQRQRAKAAQPSEAQTA